MITGHGVYPEDCNRIPMYPLTPQITLTISPGHTDFMGDDTTYVEAWAVGNDCRRCTLGWSVPNWMRNSYPEMWSEGLRRLVAGVQREMEQAGIWEPKLETFSSPPQAGHRENAVRDGLLPCTGPAQAPAATAE